jgi:ppGpp synthetase/RelA/SpoT-type nucleotidyltranferase
MGYGEVVAAYQSEYDLYVLLAEFAQRELAAAVREVGVYAQAITGRAKDPKSFGIKACLGRRYADPLSEIEDKAGVRVVLVYERDVQAVLELVRRTFLAGPVERKLDALDYDKNWYLGTHVIARLTDEQVARTRPELAGRRFEIQIRTMAQSAWAEVSHAQLYKPPAEVPDSLKRRIYRLVASVELFDDQVEQFLREAEKTEGYREAGAVATMDELMARLGSTRLPDRRLTSEITAAVVPLYRAEPSRVAVAVAEFARTREDGLRNIIREAEELNVADVNPLLVQPELPMLCERLENDRINIEQAWPAEVPFDWLDDLAEKWGLGRRPA